MNNVDAVCSVNDGIVKASGERESDRAALRFLPVIYVRVKSTERSNRWLIYQFTFCAHSYHDEQQDNGKSTIQAQEE